MEGVTSPTRLLVSRTLVVLHIDSVPWESIAARPTRLSQPALMPRDGRHSMIPSHPRIGLESCNSVLMSIKTRCQGRSQDMHSTVNRIATAAPRFGLHPPDPPRRHLADRSPLRSIPHEKGRAEQSEHQGNWTEPTNLGWLD